MPGFEYAALIELAKSASASAYAPYSRYPVGAAVLTSDGTKFPGCNIENASYSLGICAERVALFKAVCGGFRSLEAIAIFTPTEEPVSPCGACRQVLFEFAPRLIVISACSGANVRRWTLDELLPDGFGSGSLP